MTGPNQLRFRAEQLGAPLTPDDLAWVRRALVELAVRSMMSAAPRRDHGARGPPGEFREEE